MSRIFKSTSFMLLAMVALAALATPASAIIVVKSLDEFGTDQYVQASGANGSFGSGSVTGVDIIGDHRGVFANKTSGSNNSNLRIEALDDELESTFNVSRASGIGGNVLVQWDGGTTAPGAFDPLNNLEFLLTPVEGDFTTGDALGIVIRVLEADIVGQSLRLTLFGADGTVASEQVVVLPSVIPPGSFDALFPFAGFTLRPGAASVPNPNAIRAFTLSVTGPTGADVTLDLIGTYAVPEPATVGGFGLAAAGVMARFRRRRRVAAA